MEDRVERRDFLKVAALPLHPLWCRATTLYRSMLRVTKEDTPAMRASAETTTSRMISLLTLYVGFTN
jgi:hypothetical protein